MRMWCIIYQKIKEGGQDDGLESTKIRISDDGTHEKEEGGNTHPSVDVLDSFSDRLVKHICEICD